jgi:hypothetical protein
MGHHDAQVSLGEVRDTLLENCENIPNGRPLDAIVIPAPPEKRSARPRAASSKPWDDDVPF